MKNFEPVEPLKSNRWLIRTEGMDIEPFLFRKYKLFNEGEDIIFTTEFYETVAQSYNPKDLLNIVGFSIEYLDPIGTNVSELKFDVKGINFKRKDSYSKDDLMITKLRVVVNKDSMKILKQNQDE
jgi:hypothetical protein